MAMSTGLLRTLGAVLTVHSAILFMVVGTANSFSPFCPITGFANFGDSLTDTGNSEIAFPFFDGPTFSLDAEHPPYGETFFGAPAKRFSNGRLVPDFFSLAFGIPLLDAYFAVASFNYYYGINFANAGANAAVAASAHSPFAVTPFQTSQFIRFKNSQASTVTQDFGVGCAIPFEPNLPPKNILAANSLSTWLYTITAGANDLLLPLEENVTADPSDLTGITTTLNTTIVTAAVNAIITAIQTLYGTGARQFLIYGLPASGCLPVTLSYLAPFGLPTDSLGCIISANSIVLNFNAQLLAGIKVLRGTLAQSNIAFFDYYSAHIALITNPLTYGFDPAVTKIACCGAPGPGNVNFNRNITCGHPNLGSNVCNNPDKYISWDGVHFTEAFYRKIALFALNAQFTDNGVNYVQLCGLNFAYFGSNITFSQAYPGQLCNNLFT